LFSSPTSQPIVLVADHAGGVAVNAHLLFQPVAIDAVALARLAFGVGDELRYDEQADAARAFRRAFDPRQDEMDDVLGHVVFAARDPDLAAGDPVAAVALRNRLGAQEAEVGAAMRLGQVHGPAPLAGGELGQVERLLGVRTAVQDGRIGAVGQARIHREGHVGRRAHLRERQVDHMRQALAAIGRLGAEGRPAAFDQLGVGLLEAGRGLDRMIGAPGAALLVADVIERRQDFAGEPSGLFDDLLDHVHRGVGEGGQLGVGLDLQHVAQQEDVLADGGLIGHGRSNHEKKGLRPRRMPWQIRSAGRSWRRRRGYLACSRSPRRSRSTWS
jgi:hypothetical protein